MGRAVTCASCAPCCASGSVGDCAGVRAASIMVLPPGPLEHDVAVPLPSSEPPLRFRPLPLKHRHKRRHAFNQTRLISRASASLAGRSAFTSAIDHLAPPLRCPKSASRWADPSIFSLRGSKDGGRTGKRILLPSLSREREPVAVGMTARRVIQVPRYRPPSL